MEQARRTHAALTAAALIFLGAAAGAPLRYLTDRFVQARHDSPSPWGTFSYETLRLAEQEAYFYAAMNLIVSVVAGVGAALLSHTYVAAMVG
ncbi:fluoride efflux transporter CrcB [Lentzea roselyniae]|uniref:Fluoride efflux transporter CrcB n=1 Tax=Lentzea roselyniae TaxID=531940 RepID=A0ABP7B0K4_9PSEU